MLITEMLNSTSGRNWSNGLKRLTATPTSTQQPADGRDKRRMEHWTQRPVALAEQRLTVFMM